jgi:hypothetical protein
MNVNEENEELKGWIERSSKEGNAELSRLREQNEKLRGLLLEASQEFKNIEGAHSTDREVCREMANRIDAFLSQQGEPCQDCDAFGDVHGPDGEYIGRCKCGKAEPVPAQNEREFAIELTKKVHRALGLSDSYLNVRDSGNGFERFKYDDTQRAYETIFSALAARPAQTAPQQEQSGLVEVVSDAVRYLDSNKMNLIHSGSILHRKLSDALSAQRGE